MSSQLIWLAAGGGLAAGVLSSVAGLGGGLVLIALLSIALTPQEVVALTAPVLMLGNLDRTLIYRRKIDRSILPWFLLGALPAAAFGAALLPHLPTNGLRLGMATLLLSFVLYNVVPHGLPSSFLVPDRAFVLVGIANGGLSSTIGGGGPVTAPFIHARGLLKGAFIGTESSCGLIVNLLKTAIFVASGLLLPQHFSLALASAITMAAGNRLGKVLLGRMSERFFEGLLFTLLAAIGARLAVQGLS